MDEPGELIAGEERPLERRIARHLEMLGVRQHGLDHLLRIAELAQDRRAVLRVLVERGVDLVVEVVEQRGHPPELLVLAEAPRIGRRRGLDRERMPQKRLVLRVLGEGRPGLFACRVQGGRYDTAALPITVAREAAVESFVIEGGRPLNGRVRIAGNKNGALPVLAACLLTDEPVVLGNIPRIRDVDTMLALRADLGAAVDWQGDNEVRVHAAEISKTEVDEELSDRIRGSFLFAGPLLARYGHALLSPPGGDFIGRRPLDTHIHAFQQLGADVSVGRRFELRADRLLGKKIFLDEASVMGTENAVMAASLAAGETVLVNAACEPHVQDLCRFLVSLGARIDGIGSNVLRIEGVERLSGGEHRIGAEHIEAASFIGLAAVTGGDVTVDDVEPDDLMAILAAFDRLGIAVEVSERSVRVPPGQELVIRDDLGDQIPKIEDGPWPMFPADLTSIALAVATQARGTILIFEKMFENRLFFVDKLVRMGARIILCDPHRAVISGPARLHGERLESPDIRAGMAMLIAALCAEGTSVIGNISQIDRGYERIDDRLRALGASIERTA
jgi:UDP-N-acetylglucosamine 1-carboxyvinyltransferase